MSLKLTLPFIDYAAVKAATTMEMVLHHYGLLEKMNPRKLDTCRGCCPIHHGSNDSEFSITLSKNLWHCFSKTECNAGGNHLDLVARIENCTLHEAAWQMNEWFSLGQEAVSKTRPRPDKPVSLPKDKTVRAGPPRKEPAPVSAAAPPDGVKQEAKAETQAETGENKPLAFTLQNLDPSHAYFAERGLAPETIEEFGLAFCNKGIMAGRIVIPIHNPAGELVAYAGRWPGVPPDGKEKYRLPGGFKKSLELFNAHRAFAEPADQPLVIVEGYFDALHLWQHGVRRVVALMGCSLSPRQEELIAQQVAPQTRLVLMLDGDEAGKAAQLKTIPLLAEYAFIRSFRYPEGLCQPDGLTGEHLSGLR
jgi:DNA primase